MLYIKKKKEKSEPFKVQWLLKNTPITSGHTGYGKFPAKSTNTHNQSE
jgi:hypothetical protein